MSVSEASEGGSVSVSQASGTPNYQVLANIGTDDVASHKSEVSSVSGGVPVPAQQGTGLVTARFMHVVTDEGHAVITGRDGETLQRCEDEPIHIPGAIQSFGLLIALREENEKLVVRVVSENSDKIIGYTPQQLFKIDSFLDIFSDEQADNLLDHIDFIREEGAGDVVTSGPDVFLLSIKPPHARTRRLWCAMHLSETDPGLIICEFELEDDATNPLVPPEDRITPEMPEDTLGSEPTHEELIDSTVNINKPLRILRSARKKRSEAAAMEVFNIMSQVQEQLATAPTLQMFLKVLIGIVKELTGFHRVMVYQFDHAWNGRVVAELVDPRATKDLYKGLNFPASDIPKQARDLYKINKVRLLYDRDQEPSRLVCRTLDDLEKPLDMTHANLRAMSPIHIKYLANMGVRSSMSISISAFNELWGLISCHTYGSRGMRVSFPIRKMCRLVGDTASRNVERLSYTSRLQARKLINTSSTAKNPSGYIVASSDDLLKLFEADLGALSIRDETKILGNPRGHLQEVLAMVEYLRMRRMSAVFSSQDFTLDFPDLRYDPGWKFLAGVLFVPLSTGGNDFIAFFRRGVLQEVKWAGNPYEKFVKEGTEGYLEPRRSFKQWTETIVGRCRDWTDEEIETASVLCLVYGKFIEVWRQKEAALQNSQLTRLLLANSAHEVRTPLNAIINYLEIAMEGALDHDTRENLARSHSASKSLVYVINDLLDLTKAEGGQTLVKDEPLDLLQTMKEATDPFIGDAKRKNILYKVEISPALPRSVTGDHRRVRQVVSNLISNAIQHTREGNVVVEAYPCSTAQPQPGKTEIEIVVEDSGAGMSQDKVDALFKELEEVSYEEDLPDAKSIIANSVPDQPQSGNATLGLGLALVARTIRNMNGQLRVKTEEGKGSRFVIVLGFNTGGSGPAPLTHQSASPGPGSRPAISPSQQEGEVTLVYRNPPGGPDSLGTRPASAPRRTSGDSMNSLTSLRSAMSMKSDASRKSDADRLIDAIQQPLQFTEQRTSSPGPTPGESLHRRSLGSPVSSLKSKSLPSPKELKSALRTGGWEKVKDSATPLRPVRVPDDQQDEASGSKIGPRLLFAEPGSECSRSDTTEVSKASPADNFSVLVAEDDPINSKIMKKRLEKLGHSAYMTVNGEECSSAYGAQSASFDAILMDLQMPIVDGFSSTKMIRSYEKTQGRSCLSSKAGQNGRVPIFAVSASLVEKERNKYIETGFDGWILKPVDFKRVDLLLKGIVDKEARDQCLYEPGKWERGGWFWSREEHHDPYEVDTHPSQETPTTVPGPASTVDGVQECWPEASEARRSTVNEETVVPADADNSTNTT
jgi:light-regulated signal transduction histidine kinase (bacteriophytochrome)/DNA-binding NarL/FixJ family response regulator